MASESFGMRQKTRSVEFSDANRLQGKEKQRNNEIMFQILKRRQKKLNPNFIHVMMIQYKREEEECF